MGSTISSSQAAHTLLRQAHDRLYRLPRHFEGFRANLEFAEDAHLVKHGQVTLRSPRDLTMDLPLPESPHGWACQQIASLMGHRWHAPYHAGDGRFAVTLVDDEHHVQGQEIQFLDDPFASTYRLRNGAITSIERHIGEQRFVIAIQQVRLLENGQTLPLAFTATFWNTASSRLVRTEIYEDTYTFTQGVYLPEQRRVMVAEDGGLIARSLRFTDHVRLFPSETCSHLAHLNTHVF